MISKSKQGYDYRVVSVTPAGRERYLRVLVPYLLQNRGIISEHHFWLNTLNQRDISFIEALHEKYPDFFKINRKPVFRETAPSKCIWQYYIDYTDEDTLYIRFDDDICFIAPDAVKALVECRIANPEPFLVYGNIINNSICSHIQQERGLIPEEWGRVHFECMDPNGWDNPRFAERLHTRFLSDVRKGKIDQWKFSDHPINDYRRFSVNVISWLGKDMKQVPEINCRDFREYGIINPATGSIVEVEETFISEVIPRRLSRPCSICGDAIFAHFAFYTQRNYLEKQTCLLERYYRLALNERNLFSDFHLWLVGFFKKIAFGWLAPFLNVSPGRLRFLLSSKGLLSLSHDINTRLKTRIMKRFPRFYSHLRRIKGALRKSMFDWTLS